VQTNRDLQFNSRRYWLPKFREINLSPRIPDPDHRSQVTTPKKSPPPIQLYQTEDGLLDHHNPAPLIDGSHHPLPSSPKPRSLTSRKGMTKAQPMRPRNRGTKKQSTESRTGRETSSRLGDSAAYRTTTRTPAISKPSTRSRRCFCGRRVMVWRRPLPRLYTRGRNAARKRVPPALRGVCLTRGPGAQLFARWMDRL